jgi:ATP-dependent RNA helicase DeaD
LTTFQELGLSQQIMRAINQMGFEETTPIQAESIPQSLEGKDLIGQAQTGTGKTAAFGIPMIERINTNQGSAVKALVVAPTRELAIQVAEELNNIGQYTGVRSLPIYGGQDITRQIRALKKHPHIIVGTPGRLIDHIRRKTVRLNEIQMVVLDEADEMLNMGFIEDIESILKEVPEERQTLLFSATMPKPIQRIAERFMKDPTIVRVKQKEMTVPHITQQYIELHEKQKFEALTRLLDIQSPELAIVFGRTKRRVDELSQALHIRGYAAEGIHGDLTQAKRSSVLQKFKEGSIEVLVATDVAARGLDISGVTHVYNFDVPQDTESYVHRIGRTGRAGQKGLAVTFVTSREMGQLRNIEKATQRKVDRLPVPSVDDALEGQKQVIIDKLLKTVENENISIYRRFAEELINSNDSETLLAGALKLLMKEPDATPVNLTAESPMAGKDRNRGPRNNRKSGGGGGFQRKDRRPSSSGGGSDRKPGSFQNRRRTKQKQY